MNEIEQDEYYYEMGQQSLYKTLSRIEAKLDKLLEKKSEVNRPDIPVVKETMREDEDDIAKYINR